MSFEIFTNRFTGGSSFIDFKKMNLRRDTWLTGALILLCCSSFVKTQERNVFVTDTGIFTGLGNIASLVLGVGVGFILKQCPGCPDNDQFNKTTTEPTPSLSCPDGFTAITPEGEITRCYKYEQTAVKFEDAMVACAALAPRPFYGHLLTIETDAESVAINEFIDSVTSSPTFIWLGASDFDGDGIYLWNTYQRVTSGVLGGLETCLNIFSSNKNFFTADCSVPRAYICESRQA